MGVDYAGAPDGDGYDEFRCFVIDPGWTEWKHLKGLHETRDAFRRPPYHRVSSATRPEGCSG